MKKRELLWKSRQKIIKDKIQFWKKVNLLFSEKFFSKESISLIQKDKIITDSLYVTEAL